MNWSLVRTIPAIAALMVCRPALAFFEPPTLLPEFPLANQPISISVYGGECDFLEDGPSETDITRVGSAIRIVIDGSHADDLMLCFDDEGLWTYPLGAFLAGSYTVELVFRYAYPGGPIEQSLGNIAFSVSAPPSPVPSNAHYALGLLSFGLFATAASTLRRG